MTTRAPKSTAITPLANLPVAFKNTALLTPALFKSLPPSSEIKLISVTEYSACYAIMPTQLKGHLQDGHLLPLQVWES